MGPAIVVPLVAKTIITSTVLTIASNSNSSSTQRICGVINQGVREYPISSSKSSREENLPLPKKILSPLPEIKPAPTARPVSAYDHTPIPMTKTSPVATPALVARAALSEALKASASSAAVTAPLTAPVETPPAVPIADPVSSAGNTSVDTGEVTPSTVKVSHNGILYDPTTETYGEMVERKTKTQKPRTLGNKAGKALSIWYTHNDPVSYRTERHREKTTCEDCCIHLKRAESMLEIGESATAPITGSLACDITLQGGGSDLGNCPKCPKNANPKFDFKAIQQKA